MLRIRGLAPLTVVTAVLIFGTPRFAWAGAQTATEKILHSFNPQPTDGFHPYANLISDAAGNLYGVTSLAGGTGAGGTYNVGSVFELSPRKDGGWKEKVLYSFNNVGGDGYNPSAGLVLDTAGNLYGTTELGGTDNCGTVFELSPKGRGSWTEEVLFSFNFSDGCLPIAGLTFDSKGNLYGTTWVGGTTTGDVGTVFELSPPAESGGAWTETVLHSFPGTGPTGMRFTLA